MFTCSVGSGISGSIPIGTYDLGFTLLGSAGLITTAPRQMGVVIKARMTTQIMPVVFALP
jgi:hypothetical protein